MALEEFEKEELGTREKGIVRMRTIMNYGMGVFWTIAGLLFMFPIKYTRAFVSQYDPVLIKIFAAVCIVYGAFRMYRGYKKNYFRD
jgi:hypothetical protein